MLLTDEQIGLLKDDLDYILARTKCDTIQLAKGQVANAIASDPDVLLDLVAGLPESDARWLSLPPDVIRPLIQHRLRGTSGRGTGSEA
jgi:hypothetical protein